MWDLYPLWRTLWALKCSLLYVVGAHTLSKVGKSAFLGAVCMLFPCPQVFCIGSHFTKVCKIMHTIPPPSGLNAVPYHVIRSGWLAGHDSDTTWLQSRLSQDRRWQCQLAQMVHRICESKKQWHWVIDKWVTKSGGKRNVKKERNLGR